MNDSPTARRPGALPVTLVLIIALAAGLGLWAGQRWFVPAAPEPLALQSTLLYPTPRPIPAFSLDAPNGGRFTEADLQGRWTVLFVGFTHCPDVCPTTLGTLAAADKALADLPETQRPQILFVSVDPERDSADRAAEYAHYFAPQIRAATADIERLTAFTRSLGMVFMKTPLENEDYTIDHTASLALINPQGQLTGMIRPPLQPAVIAADLRRIIEARS